MRCGLLAGLVLVAAACASPAPASAATPGLVLGGDFFGDGQIGRSGQTGAQWARVFMYWADVESGGGADQEQLSAYAEALSGLKRNGLKVVVVVTGAPPHASNVKSGLNAPPRDPDEYARFIAAMAGRFTQVDAWEIWNEPDSEAFWAGGPDPGAYAALLRAAYPAVKRANPRAKVIMGGLTGNNYPFLEAVYGAGAKGSFDAVAVHTDTACNITAPDDYQRDFAQGGRISRFSFLGYREVRATMLANGDADKKIWNTEMGWSTSAASCDRGVSAGQKAGGVSRAQQADFLARAFHCMAEDPYVEVALWFSLKDFTREDTPDHRHGLLDFGFEPKPAFATFQDIARRGDTRTGPCGDFAGPEITATAPVAGTRFSSSLPVALSSSDPSGVLALVARVEGVEGDIVSRIDFAAPPRLDSTATWVPPVPLPDGPKTVRVVAYDRLGNASSTTVGVVRAPDAVPTTVRSVVSGRGRRRAVSVTVAPVPPGGLARAVFEKRRGTRWVPAHRFRGDATRPLRAATKLTPGRWRVRASYDGSGPFSPSAAKPREFRISARPPA